MADSGALPGSRADASSLQAVSTKGFDPARKDISDAAKCILSGWFSQMRPGKGELTFNLGESKPREWAVAALHELLAAKIISVRAFNEYGGLVFTPLVDCHEAFVWMMKGGKKVPEAGWVLTEPIKSLKEARQFQREFLAAIAQNPPETGDG